MWGLIAIVEMAGIGEKLSELFIFLNLQSIRPNTDPSRQTKPPIRPNRGLILSNTAPSRQNKPPILQEFTVTSSTFTMIFPVEYGSKSTD